MRETPTNRKLLLFIHGWMGDPEETWRKFPNLAAGDPRFMDVDIWVVDYPTFLWRRNLNLVYLAKWIGKRLDARDMLNRYQKVAIVAHSMGGLIAREIIILKRLREDPRSFGILIEVATPHDGANYTGVASFFGISHPLTEEMQKGSSYLAKLQAYWDELEVRPRTHCYTSPHDYTSFLRKVPSLSATGGITIRSGII